MRHGRGGKGGDAVGFQELISTFGWPIGSAIFAVLCLYFEWVVPGKRFRKVERERDALFRLAVSTTRLGERSASVAQRAVDALTSHRETDDDADAT